MPSISVNVASTTDAGYSVATYKYITANNKYYSRPWFSHWDLASARFGGRRTRASKFQRWFDGLRFLSLSIPQGATINSATLSIHPRGTPAKPPRVKIFGNNVDNAGPFGTSNRVRTINKTAHSVLMDTSGSGSVNNVTTIVQDIVNRSGWASGNNMAFAAIQTSVPPNTGGNNAYYFTGYGYTSNFFGGTLTPNLSVTYTSGGGGQIFMEWLPQYG